MKKSALAMLLLVAAPAALAQSGAPAAKSPAEAIALADRVSTNGVTGRYEMIVASTGKNLKATFINSTPDYTGGDNLTFSMSPIVAKMFAKHYGAPPEEYLKGKHIVVDGVVKKQLIVNTLYGKPRSVNRIGHNVEIRHFSQIALVE